MTVIESSLFWRMFRPYNNVINLAIPHKVMQKVGIFKYDFDVNPTTWCVPSPLYISPTTTPLSKFKDHLPNFSRNDT